MMTKEFLTFLKVTARTMTEAKLHKWVMTGLKYERGMAEHLGNHDRSVEVQRLLDQAPKSEKVTRRSVKKKSIR